MTETRQTDDGVTIVGERHHVAHQFAQRVGPLAGQLVALADAGGVVSAATNARATSSTHTGWKRADAQAVPSA